ncbi:MAG: DUF4868 domain-containing protein [Flavobacteriales bacterium]|nr:DUF4868 domain-containing protein [Flavobacteriales bacterium]
MTLEELKQKLAFLFDGKTATDARVYFLVNGNLRFADIEDAPRKEIKDGLVQYIRDKFIDNETLNYSTLSEGEDKKNTVYRYDLEQVVSGLSCMDSVLEHKQEEPLSFSTESFTDVDAFVFVLGTESQKVVLYKRHLSFTVLRKNKLRFIKSADHLVRLNDDVINMETTFEFMKVAGHLFVLSTKVLENNFNVDQVRKNEANGRLAFIEGLGIVENIEALKDVIGERKYAKHILRVRTTAKALELPFAELRDFVRSHPKLKRRLKFNGTEDKFMFHTMTSRELFLKLLHDDFVESRLTKTLYDSADKKGLTADEEPDEGEE